MWTYRNPVRIRFGEGSFATVVDHVASRSCAVVTYPEPYFKGLVQQLAQSCGAPLMVIDDVAPNPDYRLLNDQCTRFAGLATRPEVIIALGGGSVIDSAKVFAASNGDFSHVRTFLETGQGAENLRATPIIAIPTTAGTGSDVTCWATVWDEVGARKFSLARDNLYPEATIIDPALMLSMPDHLTLSTALDALSHALESIWNVNANPISLHHATAAAKRILCDLAPLLRDPGNLEFRASIAEAALGAGLAFSNTKTAIAHNISYPITLEWGVPHGIACSFTLPLILRSVIGLGGRREAGLKEIFGEDLAAGADDLEAFLEGLGVSTHVDDYGVPADRWSAIIECAFAGERGRNFIGAIEDVMAAKDMRRGR